MPLTCVGWDRAIEATIQWVTERSATGAVGIFGKFPDDACFQGI